MSHKEDLVDALAEFFGDQQVDVHTAMRMGESYMKKFGRVKALLNVTASSGVQGVRERLIQVLELKDPDRR